MTDSNKVYTHNVPIYTQDLEDIYSRIDRINEYIAEMSTRITNNEEGIKELYELVRRARTSMATTKEDWEKL